MSSYSQHHAPSYDRLIPCFYIYIYIILMEHTVRYYFSALYSLARSSDLAAVVSVGATVAVAVAVGTDAGVAVEAGAAAGGELTVGALASEPPTRL